MNFSIQRYSVMLFIAFIVGFALLSLLYAMFRLHNHQEFVTGQYNQKQKAENTQGVNITLTETKEGIRKWQMKVKKLKYNGANTIAQMNHIEGTVFNDKGEPLFHFDAPKGTFFKKDGQVVLDQSVHLHAPTSKIDIQAPHMEWSSQSNEILAKGGIALSKADFGTTKANQAKFKMDLSEIQLSGNVVSNIGNTSNN